MSEINIFDKVKIDMRTPAFFKFEKIGDSVQGTYTKKSKGTDSYGNEQIIYQLDNGDKVWLAGFRTSKFDLHQDMADAKYGEIVGIKYVENKKIKNKAGQIVDVKIYRAARDPKIVDPNYKDSGSTPEKDGVTDSRAHMTIPNTAHMTIPNTAHMDIGGEKPMAKDDWGEFSNFGKKENQPLPTASKTDVVLSLPQKKLLIKKLAMDKIKLSVESTDEEIKEAVMEATGIPFITANYDKILTALENK